MCGIVMAYMNGLFKALNAPMLSVDHGLNARLNSIESRLASIEGRMMNLETTVTARFDLLMGRLTDLEKEIRKN